MSLRWCEAEKAHRSALQAFICTDPPRPIWDRKRGRYHPRQWEYDVQAVIHRLKPPFQLPRRVLLGFDGDALRAVIAFLTDDESNEVFVQFVACDQETRGSGYAAEAYAEMFVDLASLGWVGGFEVEGNVHRSNEASKKAFQRAGGLPAGKNGEYEIWRLKVPERASAFVPTKRA